MPLRSERQRRFRRTLLGATGSTELRAGDILLVDLVSPTIDLLNSYYEFGVEPVAMQSSYFSDHHRSLGVAEVMLPPDYAPCRKNHSRVRVSHPQESQVDWLAAKSAGLRRSVQSMKN